MAAMRIARTVTGREKIVIFNGDYHGQFDEVLVKGVQHAGAAPRSVPVAPGIPPASVQNMIVLDYGTPATLEWLREHARNSRRWWSSRCRAGTRACSRSTSCARCARITAAAGTAFVLDEVVTGFRSHPGGIQALAGVRADLATYGKVVGGGLPIGILAGSARFMDALDGGRWSFGDASVPEVGVTFFAGTFVRHPLVLAAARAVLLHLKHAGPQLQEQLGARTAALAAELNALFTAHGIAHARRELLAAGSTSTSTPSTRSRRLLFYHLRLRGIHIQDGFPLLPHHRALGRRPARHLRGVPRQPRRAAVPSASSATRRPRSRRCAVPARAAAAEGAIPLTESQTEIWLAAQMGDEASCAFNESVSLTLRGALDAAALREALALLFARHDALRARFTATGESMHIARAGPARSAAHRSQRPRRRRRVRSPSCSTRTRARRSIW